MTPTELEQLLIEPFSEERWTDLLPRLLPGISLFSQPHDIPLLSAAEQSVAKSLKQFGTARLADGKGIGFFIIEAKPGVDLSRNRVGLRQLAARWIDQVELHAALALSYQPDVGFYRLTFAARESVFTPDLQITTLETASRRFTYVLGTGERRRTASQRLAVLADRRPELTLKDVIDAFSVDKLNKEFFADFCRARSALTSEIQSTGVISEDHARAEAQTMLNRLLFLYFLQRKGWLHRDRCYLASAFQRIVADQPHASDFYSDFLAPVFGIVSTEWGQREKTTSHISDTNPHRHDLPFLNGGLFSDELVSLDDTVRRRRTLRIGNAAFHRVFTDLFERYNFTIHEDSERDTEVAVDPEMLGRIFEELVLTSVDSETGGKSRRHDTGSHYTPRPIVRYLCREALAAWLADQPPFASKAEARPCVDALLSLDASIGLDDEAWETLRALITPTEAADARDALFELRACDPAVGSGAFPLGLLHELLNAARLLDARARGKDPADTDPDWLYDNKKRLIERCLYGTDIQEEALEICKLRLWLSLMVDHQIGVDPDHCDRRAFAAALKKVEPLPNLEFKIRRANALVDTIRGQRLHIERPRQDASIRAVLSRLRDAKHDFYTADTAAKKRRFRFAIYLATAELAQHELSWMKRDLGLSLDDSPEIRARIAQLDRLEHALGDVRRQLDAAKKLKAGAQEDALERLRTWWEDPTAPTFVWQFDFAEVFHRAPRTAPSTELLPEEKEPASAKAAPLHGFDLQLGNPPYIRLQVLKRSAPEDVDWYREHYAAAKKGNYDLYVVFIERALKLLHGHGQLAFIVPHRFFNAQYGEPLRELIAAGRHLSHVVHFGDQQIFPGATNYVCLLFLSRAGAESCRFVRGDNLRLWLATFRGVEIEVPKRKISASDWNFSVGKTGEVFDRLSEQPLRLGEVTQRISQGIRTSANEVYVLKLIRSDGEIVTAWSEHLDHEVRVEADAVQNFLQGREVKAYEISECTRVVVTPYDLTDDGVSLIPEGRLKKEFPLAHRYLTLNKEYLSAREDGRFAGPEWYQFGRSQNIDLVLLPKVIVPDIANRASFAMDAEGAFAFTSGYGITMKPDATLSLTCILGLANSAVLDFFWRRVSTPLRGGYFRYFTQFIEQLPLPEMRPSDQHALEKLVAWLLFLHRQPSVRAATAEHPCDPQMAAWFERWVNALVYELFFPEELRARGLGFLPLTEDLAPPPPDADADATLATVRTTVETLSAPGHALRCALDQLQTLDLVRTIEGGA